MKKLTKAQRDQVELFKKLNIPIPDNLREPDEDEPAVNSYPTEKHSKEMSSLQAEAVLISLEWPKMAGMAKLCKECGGPFTTRYPGVGYCNDLCRADALKKKGIVWWKPGTTETRRWGGHVPPSIIPTEALVAMKTIIEKVERETGVPVDTTGFDFSSVPKTLESSFPVQSLSLEPSDQNEEVQNDPVDPQRTSEVLPDPSEPELEDSFLALLNAQSE